MLGTSSASRPVLARITLAHNRPVGRHHFIADCLDGYAWEGLLSLSGAAFAVALSVAFALPIYVVRIVSDDLSSLWLSSHCCGCSCHWRVWAAFASVITAIGITGIPRTVGLIQPLLLFLSVGGSACALLAGGMCQSHSHVAACRAALVYGAGSAGRQLH